MQVIEQLLSTRHRRREISARLLALAALLGALGGCSQGPTLGDVSGRVTYKGEPVPDAIVDFRPVGEGKQSMGFTNADGDYELQYTLRRNGALLGRHKVSVRIYPREGAKAVPVPARFGAKSQVEFDVQSGSNRFDIELSS
jgi:hypothetical protein